MTDLDTKTILIAEDEAELREAIDMALRTMGGFDTILAADGATAITAATEQQPDMLLLDFNLPEKNGVDIITAVRAAGEWGARVPISLLTVEANMDRISEAITAGGPNTNYLTKTDWSLEKVVDHVRQTIGE